MAVFSLETTYATFYTAGSEVSSRVVGYESQTNRVVRYTIEPPGEGANHVEITIYGGGLSAGSEIPIRFFIGTDEESHLNAGVDSEYTGELTLGSDGKTFTGSADFILMPGTTYYLWFFPGRAKYGYYSWYGEGDSQMVTSGGALSSISLSATTVQMGKTLAITINRYAAFTHKVVYSFAGQTGVIASAATTSAAWAVSLELAKLIPGATSGKATVICTTMDGSTEIGSVSVEVALTVPNNDKTKPAGELSVTPVSGLAATFAGLFIQGKTKVTVAITATSTYSEVDSISTVFQGVTKTGASVTFDYPAQSGSLEIRCTITDKRGYSTVVTGKVTVIPYSNPSIAVTACARCDADGNLSDSGTYLKIAGKRIYSKVVSGGVQKNFCDIRYRYKTAAAEQFGAWIIIKDGVDTSSDEFSTGALLGGSLEITSSYIVEIGVVDDISDPASTAFAISTDTVYMHRTKNAMGLGKYVEGENMLDVAWDTYLRGDVFIGANGVTLKEYILAVISEGG